MKNKEVLPLKAKKFYSSICVVGMIIAFVLLILFVTVKDSLIKGNTTFGIVLCSLFFFFLLFLYMYVNNHRLVVYPDRFEKYNLFGGKKIYRYVEIDGRIFNEFFLVKKNKKIVLKLRLFNYVDFDKLLIQYSGSKGQAGPGMNANYRGQQPMPNNGYMNQPNMNQPNPQIQYHDSFNQYAVPNQRNGYMNQQRVAMPNNGQMRQPSAPLQNNTQNRKPAPTKRKK